MYRSFKNGSTLLLRAINKTSKVKEKSNSFSSEATFEVHPFKLHNIEGGPSTSVKVTKEDASKFYYQMQLIRRMENSAAALYRDKSIRGFCHLYSGQEAICVGMKAAMRKNDCIITSYRAHGWGYVMGLSAASVLTELTGRAGGCARGKGGSMHMYAPNFYGGNGIVGAQVPLGAGIAFACKYKKNGGACLALYGDGAANQGQIFETYNMSALWKLPVIFVCENNRYGMGTATKRSASNDNYYTRGDVIPGIWVDGMDLMAVKSATAFALEFVQENGPMVIEAYTYRYFGHSMSDPGISYRSREEVQSVRDKQDPILQFKNKCTEAGILSEEDMKAMDDKIKAEVEEAAAKAKADKEIGLDELTYDIYTKHYDKYVRGVSGQKMKHEIKGKPVNI